MEPIRHWALSVCFACVAAGILGQLSCARKRFSVIKPVLTLYILAIAFAPLREGWTVSLPVRLPDAPVSVSVPDTQTPVLRQAEAGLSDALRTALDEASMPGCRVTVTLQAEGTSVQVRQVTVTSPAEYAQEKIKDVIVRAMGTDVPIQTQEEAP